MLLKNRTGANPETNRAFHTSSGISFLSVLALSFIAMALTVSAKSAVTTSSQPNERLSIATAGNHLTIQILHHGCDKTVSNKTNYTM